MVLVEEPAEPSSALDPMVSGWAVAVAISGGCARGLEVTRRRVGRVLLLLCIGYALAYPDRLDVAYSLTNRVLRAEPFSFHSGDADMTGTGTLNLSTDALQGRVNVTLSEALSAQAGTDLIRYTREGNRVVLPAAIGGTLQTPRLTIDVAAAAKRGLRNETERRIKGLLGGFGR